MKIVMKIVIKSVIEIVIKRQNGLTIVNTYEAAKHRYGHDYHYSPRLSLLRIAIHVLN